MAEELWLIMILKVNIISVFVQRWTQNIKFADLKRKEWDSNFKIKIGKSKPEWKTSSYEKHENGLCSLCKVKENIKHLLLDCFKENISNLLKNTRKKPTLYHYYNNLSNARISL